MRWLVLLVVLLFTAPAAAQAQGKIYRLGILTHGFAPDPNDPPYKRAVEGARLLGFEVGRNVELHWGAAEGDNTRLPGFAREFVQKPVDVIVAIGDWAAKAAKEATSQIPLVMVAGDPVANGLVESLARPGGNLTGVVLYGTVADIKRVEMLAQYVGPGKKIAYLLDATVSPEGAKKVKQAAIASKVELVTFWANQPSEYEAAFKAMQNAGASAVLVGTSLNFLTHRSDLAARAAAARLATMCSWREMAQAGCLLTFGTNLEWVFGRVVSQVVSIVAFGQKPADMPIEQASSLDLIINMKTARALGVTIPDTLAARANDVLE
jgi:putative ABC transport system substrate-binding protein